MIQEDRGRARGGGRGRFLQVEVHWVQCANLPGWWNSHPYALPEGEGTAKHGGKNFQRASYADRLTMILPLPLGEGRGEGNSIQNRVTGNSVLLPTAAAGLRHSRGPEAAYFRARRVTRSNSSTVVMPCTTFRRPSSNMVRIPFSQASRMNSGAPARCKIGS